MVAGNALQQLGDSLDKNLENIYFALGSLAILSLIPLSLGLKDIIRKTSSKKSSKA